MLMAMARSRTCPRSSCTAGRSCPGRYHGRDITIQDVFEAVGAHARGTIDDAELLEIERSACPTTGSCAGMYTANTMAAAAEALGMSLPGAASPAGRRLPTRGLRPRDRASRRRPCCSRATSRPRDILTREAFENAIAVVMALAGSTNAVLHLLAIAREAGVELRARRLRSDLARRAAPGRRPPRGQVRDDRPRPRRRRARRDARAARGGSAARRWPSRSPAGRSRENLAISAPPSPGRDRGARRRRTRSMPRAARRSCAARSRPTAR